MYLMRMKFDLVWVSCKKIGSVQARIHTPLEQKYASKKDSMENPKW